MQGLLHIGQQILALARTKQFGVPVAVWQRLVDLPNRIRVGMSRDCRPQLRRIDAL